MISRALAQLETKNTAQRVQLEEQQGNRAQRADVMLPSVS